MLVQRVIQKSKVLRVDLETNFKVSEFDKQLEEDLLQRLLGAKVAQYENYCAVKLQFARRVFMPRQLRHQVAVHFSLCLKIERLHNLLIELQSYSVVLEV